MNLLSSGSSHAVLLLSVDLRPATAQDSLRHTGGHGEGDHYEHSFDDFFEWTENTMAIEEEAYI